MTSEQKVGALFILGIGLLLAFTLFVTDIGNGGSDYNVRFPRVSRLKNGDLVTYNGVKVGSVVQVRPVLEDDRPEVEVAFRIEKTHRAAILVGPGTRFRIREGMLDGSHLEIVSDGGRPLADQKDLAGLRGTEPAGIDEAVASVQGLIEENRAEVREAIKALRGGIANFGEMSGEVRDVVRENREALGKAVVNLGDVTGAARKLIDDNAESLRLAIARAAEALDRVNTMLGENRDGVREAVLRIGGAAAAIEGAVTENREDLRTVVASLAAVGPRLDAISRDLEVITAQVARGQGTIGKLVMEDTLHTRAVAAVDSFNQRLEEVKPVTSGISQLRFIGGIEGGTNLDSGVKHGLAYLRLEPRPWKFYQGGVSYQSAPDDRWPVREDPEKLHVDFTLLLGWRFLRDDEAQRYRLTVAAGMIDTEFGGWAELGLWGHWLNARVLARRGHIAWRPDERRYEDSTVLVRATLEASFWDGRITAIAGVDDLGDVPGPWFGLRGELLDQDLRNLLSISGLAR